jgi:(R,R)-butanediol dehydrogenase/meso-butanediol dehydrogenase/diacetyl reductase
MIGRDPLAPPHGAFAPRIAVDARRLIPVSSSLSDVQAAMVEPATVALHAVRRTPPRPDETVIVQGCGPIGLFVLQCALAEGGERVVAVEPNPARRQLAASLGADAVWTPEEARAELADRPADLVFECAGAPAAVQGAVDLVRRGGRVNLVGVTRTATVQPSVWAVKEVTLTGSIGYRHEEFASVMDFMASGAVKVEPLHDATVPLSEAAGAFASLAADSAYAVKVLVDPREA